MTKEVLIKLRKIFDSRWNLIILNEFPNQPGSFFHNNRTTELVEANVKSAEKWNICLGSEIGRFNYPNYDWDINGNVFEEIVVIPDPAGISGEYWLEMSKDTALKVLALGLP